MLKPVMRLLGMVLMGLACLGPAMAPGAKPSKVQPSGLDCQSLADLPMDAALATDCPDRYAWQLFADLSRPVGQNSDGSVDTAWERWSDVRFLSAVAQPNMVPHDRHRPIKPNLSFQNFLASIDLDSEPLSKTNKKGLMGLLLKNPSFPGFAGSVPRDELVQINDSMLIYIQQHKLWALENSLKFFSTPHEPFPTASIAVKAKLTALCTGKSPTSCPEKNAYHWQVDDQGTIQRLDSLHIESRILPDGFWATWERIDQKTLDRCGPPLQCRDTFGYPNWQQGEPSEPLKHIFQRAGLTGSEWRFFRLHGSQTKFTDATGPTLLGNSQMEYGEIKSKSSSCITCHARAAINKELNVLDDHKPSGEGFVGVFRPEWLTSTVDGVGKSPPYVPLDSLWILWRAQQ